MESLLQIHDLEVCYRSSPEGRVRAVRGVTFDLAAGEAVGLLGESGCGKTTLALSLLRLLPPAGRVERGAINFRGVNLLTLDERGLQKIRGAGISLIYQEPGLALNPVMRVGEQVAEVVRAHQPVSRDRARELAKGLLDQVGLGEGRGIAEAYPHQLSGGQRQRVVIAQAIAGKPSLIVADEPTTALDAVVQLEVLALLKELRQELGVALLLITHNPVVLAHAVDRVLVMYAGRLVEEGPTQRVFQEPLHPYTRGLMQSGLLRADEGDNKKPLNSIPGEPPDPANLPGGCAFEARCPDRMEICRARDPGTTVTEESRQVACFKYGDSEIVTNR